MAWHRAVAGHWWLLPISVFAPVDPLTSVRPSRHQKEHFHAELAYPAATPGSDEQPSPRKRWGW